MEEIESIVIDYNQRVSGNSISSFRVKFNDNRVIKRLALVQAAISHTEYSVNANHSIVQTNLGALALTIPRNSDVNQLMLDVQAALISIGHAGATVTLGAAGKVVINCPIALSITIGPSSVLPMLGFTVDSPSSTVLTADTIPLRCFTNAIYIQLDQGSKAVKTAVSEYQKASFVIPTNRTIGNTTQYIDFEGNQSLYFGDRINELNIRLTDAQGRLLLLEGCECVLVLRAYCSC
jgi:hypothetical protein